MEALTTVETGLKHGLDAVYGDNKTSIRFFVHKVYSKVLKNPEAYDIDRDKAEHIKNVVSSRSSKTNPQLLPVEVREAVERFEDTLEGVRNEAVSILRRKLGKIKTNKELDDISFRDIKDIVAMTIDKTRLYSGQSTENVVQYSKVDPNLSPQEAMTLLLKAREAIIEQKK